MHNVKSSCMYRVDRIWIRRGLHQRAGPIRADNARLLSTKVLLKVYCRWTSDLVRGGGLVGKIVLDGAQCGKR